jgi:hypothetical protein
MDHMDPDPQICNTGKFFLPFGLRLDDSGTRGHTGGLRPRGRGGRGGRVRAPHHTQVNDLPGRLHRHNLHWEFYVNQSIFFNPYIKNRQLTPALLNRGLRLPYRNRLWIRIQHKMEYNRNKRKCKSSKEGRLIYPQEL